MNRCFLLIKFDKINLSFLLLIKFGPMNSSFLLAPILFEPVHTFNPRFNFYGPFYDTVWFLIHFVLVAAFKICFKIFFLIPLNVTWFVYHFKKISYLYFQINFIFVFQINFIFVFSNRSVKGALEVGFAASRSWNSILKYWN